MKRIQKLMTAVVFIMLIPVAIISGQEKKSEQKIKIVVRDDGDSDVILDTLITGTPLSDSIVLKNGKTIFLAHEDSDIAPGTNVTKKFIVTETDGNSSKKEINKEITIISSDSDTSGEEATSKCKHVTCVSSGSGKSYSYTVESGNKVKDSENTKYVISRDGITVTVEGSDYDKVKDLVKEIQGTLDTKSESK